MTSTFSHLDAIRAKKKILAVVPDGLTVETFVLNSGRTLSVHIANKRGQTQSNQFGWIAGNEQHSGTQGLDLTDKAIEIIGQTWEQGHPIVVEQVSTPRQIPKITSRESAIEWLQNTQPGDQASYFTGSLAQFREDAQPRIVELQRRIDQAPAKSPRPTIERMEVADLQKQMDLIAHIDRLHTQQLITLVQRRDQVTQEIIYLAVKKGRSKMTISHPYTAMKTQKQVSGAIQKEWLPYRKFFSIANIAYEGGDDATHNSTALVEVFKDNPQHTMIVRVPVMDLGSDTTKWSAILHKKGEDTKRQIRIRFGRKNTTLEDIA